MAEPSERDSLPSPPALPPRLADPVPVIVVGTVLWFLVLAGLLLFDRDDTTWLWTSLAGGLLGITGYGVFAWQRSAARRGSRTAQRDVQP